MIGTTAAILGAAAIGAGSNIASGAASAGAAKSAASANANALTANNTANIAEAERNRAENARIIGVHTVANEGDINANRDLNNTAIDNYQSQGEGLYRPLIGQGGTAGDAIQKLLGLSGDATAQADAFKNWANSAGMGFQLKTGADAITGSKSTAGLLNSGSTLKALDQYGQGVGSTYFNNYLSNLAGQQNIGVNATNALSNVYGNLATLRTSNDNFTTNALTGNRNAATGYYTGNNNQAGQSIIGGNTNTTNALIGNTNNATNATIAANENTSGSINGLLNNGVSAFALQNGLGSSAANTNALRGSSFNVARGGVGV